MSCISCRRVQLPVRALIVLCLLFACVVFAPAVCGQAPPFFEQTFEHLNPGQALTHENTPALQPVFGTTKAFQDKGGQGLTPDESIFGQNPPASFLNLNGASISLAHPLPGEFDLAIDFSGHPAKPENPFGSSSILILQIALRQSDAKASDGVNFRFYANGTAEIWEGPVGQSKPVHSLKNLMIDRDKPHQLILKNRRAGITVLVDGQEKTTLNTSFAADNRGYISLGRSSITDYSSVKIRRISVHAPRDGQPFPPTPPNSPASAVVPLPKAETFPKLAIIHAMLWSGPNSLRFNHGFFLDRPCGFYENAPLAPDSPDDGGALVTQMRDLANAGINAISIDLFPPADGPQTLIPWLKLAKQSKTGIKIIPCLEPDRRALVKDHPEKNWPDILADFWKYEMDGQPLRRHPSLLTLPSSDDCVPVFLSYAYPGDKVWSNRLERVRAIGGNAFVICEVASNEVAVGTKMPDRFRPGVQATSGVYYFISESVVLHDDGLGILPDFIRFGRSFDTRKVIGASINPCYIGTTRVGNLLSPRGTYVQRAKWMEILKHGKEVDFIHFTTTNDYSEATEQECSANSTFTFLDLNKYFLARWRTGQFPPLEHPQAFLSYRKGVTRGEPLQVELVLLRPDVAGDESDQQIASRFNARLQLETPKSELADVKPVQPKARPGHVVWQFLHEPGIIDDWFVTPQVTVQANGQSVILPAGRLPSIQVGLPGEEVSRRWLQVPLHRIRPNTDMKIEIAGSPGTRYPRTIRVTGLPTGQVGGGLIERYPNPLHTTLDSKTLENGFLETFYDGPGYAPMYYKDGWIKRCVVDQLDRYSAVVRMRDDTIAFAKPTVVPAPRVDPTVVVDAMIDPGKRVLADRGPLRRDLSLPSKESGKGPIVLQDAPGKPWFLRFDGTDGISLGQLTMPSGAVSLEVWIRTRAIGKPQVILGSSGAVVALQIAGNGTVILSRTGQDRKNMSLQGKVVLAAERWHQLVGTYDGSELRLYVNGQPDGQPLRMLGVKTDEMSALAANPGLASNHQLIGDLARFCVRQKSLSPSEIRDLYLAVAKDFEPTPSASGP